MVDRWQDGKSIGGAPDDEKKKKKKKQVQFEVSEGKRGKPPVVIVEKGQIRLGEEDKKRSKQVTFEGSRPVVKAGPREVTPTQKATRPATLTGDEVEEGQKKLVLREEGQGTIEGTTPTRSRPKNKGNRVVFEAGGREGYRLGTIEVEYDGTDQDAKRIAEQIVRDADEHGLPYYNTESRLYITDKEGQKKAVINLPLRRDRIELDPWNKEANLPQSYVDIREKYASEKKKVSEPDPRDKTLILRLGNGTLDDAKAILKERMAQIKKLLPEETSYQIKKIAAADIMHQMFFEEKLLFKQDELDAMKQDPTTILKEASGIGYWTRIEKAAKLEFDYKTLGIKSIEKVKEQRPDLLVSDPLEALQIEYRQIQAKRRSKAYPVEEDQDNELKARQDELTKQMEQIKSKKFQAEYEKMESGRIEKEQGKLINILTKTPEEKTREREEIEFRAQEAERLNREAAEIASKAIKEVQEPAEVQAEPMTKPAQEIARELSKAVEIPTTSEGAMVESPDQVKARQEAAEGVKFAQSGEDTVHAVSRKGNVGSVHVHEVNGKFYRYIHYRNAEGKSKADYDGPCEKDGTPIAGRRGKKTEEKAEPKAEPKKSQVQEPRAEVKIIPERNEGDILEAPDKSRWIIRTKDNTNYILVAENDPRKSLPWTEEEIIRDGFKLVGHKEIKQAESHKGRPKRKPAFIVDGKRVDEIEFSWCDIESQGCSAKFMSPIELKELLDAEESEEIGYVENGKEIIPIFDVQKNGDIVVRKPEPRPYVDKPPLPEKLSEMARDEDEGEYSKLIQAYEKVQDSNGEASFEDIAKASGFSVEEIEHFYNSQDDDFQLTRDGKLKAIRDQPKAQQVKAEKTRGDLVRLPDGRLGIIDGFSNKGKDAWVNIDDPEYHEKLDTYIMNQKKMNPANLELVKDLDGFDFSIVAPAIRKYLNQKINKRNELNDFLKKNQVGPFSSDEIKQKADDLKREYLELDIHRFIEKSEFPPAPEDQKIEQSRFPWSTRRRTSDIPEGATIYFDDTQAQYFVAETDGGYFTIWKKENEKDAREFGGTFNTTKEQADETLVVVAKNLNLKMQVQGPAEVQEPEPAPIEVYKAEPSFRPVTENDCARFNNLTHFPIDKERENNDFEARAKKNEEMVRDKLTKWGFDQMPDDLALALAATREADYRLFQARIRAREIAPPWSVTGRSGYKGRPEKANKLEDRAYQENKKVYDRLNKILNRYSPDRPISSDDPEAVQRLQEKIEAAEAEQAKMVAANKVFKNKKMNENEKVKALGDLGIIEPLARELMKPDFAGRIGYADYQLTNNRSNIKRMKERITQLEKTRASPTKSVAFEGGYILDNAEINRIQIKFDGKPDAATVEKLKAHGFKWAPSEGAWQRFRSNQGEYWAREITGAKGQWVQEDEPTEIVIESSFAEKIKAEEVREQGVESEPVVAGAFLQEQAEMIRAAARPEDREKVEKIIEQALVEESALTKTEASLAFADGMPVSRSQAYDARAEGWQEQVRGELSRKRAISPLSGGPRHRLVSEVRVWDLKINPLSDQDAKRLLWKCDRCGEPVSYVYFVLDTEKSSDPSDSMGVGGTCCKVLTGKTPAQIKAGEREARAEQAASEATERRQGIKAEYILAHQDMIEDLEDMADEGADHYWPGARSMINWIEEKGTLSPAQEAFVNNIRNRKTEIVDYETYNLHEQLKEWIYYGFDMWAPMPLGRDNGFYSDVTKRAFGDGEREGVGLTKRQSDALFKLYDRHKSQVIERAIDMLDKDITNPQLLSTVEWLRRYVDLNSKEI